MSFDASAALERDVEQINELDLETNANSHGWTRMGPVEQLAERNDQNQEFGRAEFQILVTFARMTQRSLDRVEQCLQRLIRELEQQVP
jgi:hypothetical protein